METILAAVLGLCAGLAIAILIFKAMDASEWSHLVTEFQKNKHLTLKRIERDLTRAVIEREENQ